MTEQNPFHFGDWFDRNFVYCEDTHSFVHRFFDAINKEKPEHYTQAQHIAHRIIAEMKKEYDDFCSQRKGGEKHD